MAFTSATSAEAQILDPSTVKPVSKIRIIGNVYGGGDQAAVLGNTSVTINKGQFGGDIFGGGNGALYSDGTVKASADVGTHNADGTLVEKTGETNVIINGGELFYDDAHPSNHNVYGGGNLACNVAGDTHVTMNKGIVTNWTFYSNITTVLPEWYKWYDQAMNPNTQKTPIVAVFGAGYGAHTDVAGNTNVNIDFEGTDEITPADGESFTQDELEEIDKIIMRWMPDHRLIEQFVSAVHGGGYDGTVGAYDAETYKTTPSTGGINYDKTSYTSQTNVTIKGQPFIFNVYGGGLGSKAGADANGDVNSHVGAVYGAAKVDIQGGIINGDVFGGGAGIAGQHEIPNPFPGAMGGETVNLPYTYAAQVMRETDVTISGNSTVIFGNVYGGGDIANTGWHTTGARPTMTGHVEQKNTSLATLDYTTSLHLLGGNILGKVFGGGNGRKKDEVEQYKFIGAVIGSTNVEVNGSSIWGDIYGGGNTGCIYSCQTIAGTQGKTARGMQDKVLDGSTNVSILSGMVARDIFGGGFGDDPSGWEEDISSADISGNTFVFFQNADLEFESYWKPREVATRETMGSPDVDEPTGHFLPQKSGFDEKEGVDYRNSESDITHNLYGGGNMACTVLGNSHVYMSGAPTVPEGFNTTDYYKVCIANVAMPHFSVFGGGFGAFAKIANNAYSDINLTAGSGLQSIIGGGMNGPVGGSCQVHVGNDPMSLVHHVYGGGYYAPCASTELEITRGTFLENVFGGSVMGNVNANGASTDIATRTVIGLKSEGEHSAIKIEDEYGYILRQYTYEDHKNQITIGGNVYGANDVSGTVNGVASLTIYGGTLKGDVFGAGNGDHIGYYVPNELRYDLGAHGTDNYFLVVHHEPGAPNGNTYVGRPQTIGGVELTLEGNTADERVTVLGQVFGGGNSCTVGAWNKELLANSYASNPHLVRDDPAYFLGGGKIDVNLGSHVTIGRTHNQLAASADGSDYLMEVEGELENVSGLYMGCSGRHLATQDPSPTNNYYHHYYDASTAQYWPGFAVYKDGSTNEPLNRQEGLQSFLAYMNNILVWSDNVSLNIPIDADDIWISNFVGGGFRGSMKAKTAAGQFHYTLPRGVTIGHDIIGGAFNTDVVYRIFETGADGHTYTTKDGRYKYLTDATGLISDDADNDPTTGDYHHIEYAANGTVTGIVRFYYDGGMLSELPYGTDKAANDRINRILKKYSTAIGLPVDRDVNKDFTGTGLTDPKAFNYYKRDALVYLELDNRLEVEYVDGHVHGGNVFGGCFSSGRVEGDIWTDYRCFQESRQANSADFNLSDQSFNNAKNFETNFAMMLFGAGYGKNTNIQGSAYVRVLHPEVNPDSYIPGMAYGYPRLYNVFGGSYEGMVEGNTNIYFNPGKYGYVTGAIYGGGCNGYVGGKTYLELAGGYIDEAYGGARNANVGGGTHIWAYDGSTRWWGEDVIHSSGAAMVEGDAEKAPLFIGKLYGGTDISGQLCTSKSGSYDDTKGYQPYYTAEFWPKELTTTGTYNPSQPGENLTYIDTYLQVGGIQQSNSGFPIIGALYAAGNGERTKDFFGAAYTDAMLPTQHTTLMEISDGNIVYAFGGGNKATVTGQNYILVRSFLDSKHDIEDLGVQMYEVMKKRILSVGVDCYDEKMVAGKKVLDLKNASIQRLFGGNNIATMAIQPKWQLLSGRVNNVYSGGNMGDMTYFNPSGKPATEDGQVGGKSGAIAADGSNSNYTPLGLSITIEHPEIHIGSLYGGCRLSDVIPGGYADDGITPLQKSVFESCEDYYGATINITDGYIENVYGGNDISGTVHFGTNVNISGAVSGNVYGSGNGFYLYKWDKDDSQITEHLLKDYDTDANDKDLCYTVPASAAYGGNEANDTQKLLAINAARPFVEKAFLNIAGLEHYPAGDSNPKRVAYVKGNVFCGGNASTILGDEGSFTKFKIGSYVTLNGVFMGSDGWAYTQQNEIARFAKVNNFADMGAATDPDAFSDPKDAPHNPMLLNVYMMAVDMKAQPKDFNLNLPLKEAHIGTYCGGGNRGSMLVDKTVTLPFHHDIIIYDKIVGACLDANVKYNQGGTTITSYGGYTRKIANPATNVVDGQNVGNLKVRLDIASQFVPLVMDVPADKLNTTLNSHGENFATAAAHDFLYDNRSVGVKYTYEEFNNLFETHYESQEQFESNEGEDHQWKVANGIYAPSCNIYGGCFESGEVEGDVILNLYSNMLRYVNKTDLDKSLAQNIACFNVYGAGFGQDSHVWGNVRINMDRSLNATTMGTIGGSTVSPELAALLGNSTNWTVQNQPYLTTPTGLDCSYPSFNNIFGGGRNGKLIGNSTVEIRNGLIYSDVAGGCYASDMYGSTQVIVGYPKYWQCNTSGVYTLQRGDTWNTSKRDVYGDPVVKQSVKYLKGDLMPDNVYQLITDADKATNFTEATVTPADNGTTWDDVYIKIGRGVFGGGYSLANSTAASAGSITTHRLTAAADKKMAGRFVTFDDRYGYTAPTTGFGGNSSIMVGDRDNTLASTTPGNGTQDRDHIRISTATTVNGKTTYDGGIYGDGHLTFCEAFRAADVTRYGYAEGTAQNPILMNTFQRMDLLSINDCCLMLQGAQDFATDQIDATIYSITRINELRMNSTLDPRQKLGELTTPTNAGGAGANYNATRQRNYLAFYNNVHYLGSLITNDDFTASQHLFHGADGTQGSTTYVAEKQKYIETYAKSAKDAAATTEFKKRNVGTARNAIGMNNGYCLRIQNQEYVDGTDGKTSATYYGPIVGVCEVKLLTLQQGEGGGYVYAQNIHNVQDNFLMTSGNFVFPGIVNQGNDDHGNPIANQYIVDDCFLKHFGTPNDITTRDGALDEAHYWYVEGNKYFYNTTLTGFTYKDQMIFDLVKNDPNVILSGMEQGSQLKIERIEWLSAADGYHRAGYDAVLPNTTPDKVDDYEFDIWVGGADSWSNDMPRYTAGTEAYPLTGMKTYAQAVVPQFNIHLVDKLDNSGDEKYNNHLDEPELVKIYLKGATQDAENVWQPYEYTVTLNIVYLQGPSFEGGVQIDNCALPGERIGFSSNGLKIKTSELMPVTAHSWQILPLSRIGDDGTYEWDITRGIPIPESWYSENLDGNVEGYIPALYKQNEYTIAYIFTAGAIDFPVMPKQTETLPKEQRMIVVHNYHRMKDIVSHDLQIESMAVNITNHENLAEAKIYIEDEADLRAFIDYLNMATATYTDGEGVSHEGNAKNIPVGLGGLDIFLQKDITLTAALPAITQAFAGTFHGDGHVINLGEYGTTFLGNHLTGSVYNLGLVGGKSIASTGSVVNSYVYEDPAHSPSDDFTYGRRAYELSHAFNPTTDHDTYGDYVANYYADGDYQYATTDRAWSLRTGAPNYSSTETHHDCSHTHDAARWNDESGMNVPLYNGTATVDDRTVYEGVTPIVYRGLPAGYADDYLFFGQHLDRDNADAWPVHIEPVAKGDADGAKGGNRVYKTSGFYQSAVDRGFYYNKDAWALQPTLTAVDFTVNHHSQHDPYGYTTEGDGANTTPLAFSVDSNRDYDINGSHASADGYDGYDNASYGHVTQNLLVCYDDEADAALFTVGIYGNDTPEEAVRYHTLRDTGNGSASAISTANFHLVDKQDFNSPYSFKVDGRQWYERRPQRYRAVDDGYMNPSAWEGLSLPFNVVKEVHSEAEGNMLSHFYGMPTAEMQATPALNNRTLHHEYWLTGLVAAAGEEATFLRPSMTDGDGLFYSSHQAGWPYDYKNTYYVGLPNYYDWYDTRDDEGADTMGNHEQAWYALPHTFDAYPRITQAIPYLIAFPGSGYYEFDLSYTGPEAADQLIVFEGDGPIAVSDIEINEGHSTTTVGSHVHVGTYLHKASQLGVNAAGSAFEAGETILPFRTYMTATTPSVRRIVIRGDKAEEIDVREDDNIGDLSEPTLYIYGDGTTIVVESNYDTELRVYTPAGRLMRTLNVTTGTNRYEGFRPDIYIVGGKKLRLTE
ncbi:MAG: hypothetical protein Q4D23_04465 [Bacteroidales bacterium]|nr:hypothetical protein [Bacteroidales bacterium]